MSKKDRANSIFNQGVIWSLEGVRKPRAFVSPSEPVAHFNSLIYQQMRSHWKKEWEKSPIKVILGLFHMGFLYRVGWSDHIYDKNVDRFVSLDQFTRYKQFARKFDLKWKKTRILIRAHILSPQHIFWNISFTKIWFVLSLENHNRHFPNIGNDYFIH